MKRTITKETSHKLTWTFLVLVGLFVFAPSSDLAAQTNTLEMTIPSGPYVAPADAITRIETHIDVIKPLIEFMSPNTQEYRNLVARIDFYYEIINQLKAGKTVQESILHALSVLSSDQHSTISKAKRLEYQQEAVDLLRP